MTPILSPTAALADSNVPFLERHETPSQTNNPEPPPNEPTTQNLRTRQTPISASSKALGKRKADDIIDDERTKKKSSK